MRPFKKDVSGSTFAVGGKIIQLYFAMCLTGSVATFFEVSNHLKGCFYVFEVECTLHSWLIMLKL